MDAAASSLDDSRSDFRTFGHWFFRALLALVPGCSGVAFRIWRAFVVCRCSFWSYGRFFDSGTSGGCFYKGCSAVFKKFDFIPKISETERTALDAGVVWIEKDLFSGKPNFKNIMAESYPQLTAEKAFMDGVEHLCQMIDAWKIWKSKEIPSDVWDYIRKERFLGMIIPKEHGGLGFSALAH